MTSRAGKARLGFYWAAGCGGCEISILEIGELIFDLLDRVEILFWPCVMDFKRSDVEALEDKSMDACLVNGALRTQENIEIVRLLRRKTKVLLAYGSCAVMGGIPGLANLASRAELLERVFLSTESTMNPRRALPLAKSSVAEGIAVELPMLLESVEALHQEVEVDYFVPGCPPTEKQTWEVLSAILEGRLPEPGSVIGAGDASVCDECSLVKQNVLVSEYVRPHLILPQEGRCLLEQGMVCLGPATRSGCGARCPSVNMPCRGCYGPSGNTVDQGAKMIGLLGSILAAEQPELIKEKMDGIVDPVGTLFRFSLPGSIMFHRRPRKEKAT